MCSTMYNYCLKFRLLSQLDFELCQHQEILVARINSTQMKRVCVDSLLNSFLSKLELTFHRWKSRVVIAGTSDFMNFFVIFPGPWAFERLFCPLLIEFRIFSASLTSNWSISLKTNKQHSQRRQKWQYWSLEVFAYLASCPLRVMYAY